MHSSVRYLEKQQPMQLEDFRIESFEVPHDGTDSDTGINKYSVFFCAYIIAIATATTCKAYKSYFHSNLLNYKKAVTLKKK